MKKYFKTPFYLLALIPFVSFAQEDFESYYQPSFSVEIKTATPWSFSFGTNWRQRFYTQEEYNYETRHLALTHFTSYRTGSQGKAGLGVKYFFSNAFDDTEHNELRFTEQYNISKKRGLLEFGHRFRFEQRIREVVTYRSRYRFGIEIPLGSKEPVGEWELELQTEALLSLAQGAAPEVDQRFEIAVEHQLTHNIELSLSVEYQYEDYFHNPQTDLFFYTGLDIEL